LYILGLSFGYHDSAAVIIHNGNVLAASAEERFSRLKHDNDFPIKSIQFCLEYANIDISQIDSVVYYETPINKFDRIVRSSFSNYPIGLSYVFDTFTDWIENKKFFIKKLISDKLSISQNKIFYGEHHLSHAASAYYSSTFNEATVVVIDGVGEQECVSVFLGKENKLTKLYDVKFPHSIGLFYSAITAYLGFEVNEGEYKVMGMSGFGEPLYYEQMRKMFFLFDDGTFKLDQQYFEFLTPIDKPFTNKLIELFGPARNPLDNFDVKDATCINYANIAASAQKCTEEVIMHVVLSAIKKTAINNVCLSGGVSLNSLANGKLIFEHNINMFIQPAADDGGCALGCALEYYYNKMNNKRQNNIIFSPFLGKKYYEEEIIKSIKSSGLRFELIENEDILLEYVANVLSNNGVVGWYQGRSEWGPRALGHRSILANPKDKNMQEIVNQKVKFREPFRPFAPMITAEDANEYFDMPKSYKENSPESYMLAVHYVKLDKRDIIPAVTHVDKTARVQTVYESTNPRIYRLLKKIQSKSGVPVLMNTSFNLKDEPVVETPKDALKTFFYAGMDLLVMENFIIKKEFIL
jgi:carbamoyltransferase